MSEDSPMMLVGVGGGGAAIARGVNRAFGGGIRQLLVDTDAASGQGDEPFALIGGNRMSGRGSGGDLVKARIAAEETVGVIDNWFEGVRLAVIVTALGGGTGGGATIEIIRHLNARGIPTIVFATSPFAFEGPNREHLAKSAMALIEDSARTSFFLPLDRLVGGVDDMGEALKRATDSIASAITLFWRLVEKPGYLRLDVERICRMLAVAGRGHFAAVTVQGEDRAREAVAQLLASPALAKGKGLARHVLCGILAGDDLRLSEVGTVAEGVRGGFGGERVGFELATVNDEAVFGGRMSVVTMIFEGGRAAETAAAKPAHVKRRQGSVLNPGGATSIFRGVIPTIYRGEDLDKPTYLRKNLSLDF